MTIEHIWKFGRQTFFFHFEFFESQEENKLLTSKYVMYR